MGVAFRHRESRLKNFCNKLLKWELPSPPLNHPTGVLVQE
jgi:hypothetical protein